MQSHPSHQRSASVQNEQLPFYKKKLLDRRDSGVVPTSPKTQRDAAQTKLLASVGLDLFRTGLVIDNTKPLHTEGRHPAIAPNLLPIPEGEQIVPQYKATKLSQAIIILDGPVSGNLPGVWLGQRIELSLSVHHTITEQQRALCYVIPLGGDDSNQSQFEAEVVRNQLIQRGISPHQIIMDCNSSCAIDNIVSLIRILRHYHLSIVHVVGSSFHLPRIQHYFNRLLGSCHDIEFQVYYHSTPQDHMSRQQQREKEATEQATLIHTKRQLDEAALAVLRSLPYPPHKKYPQPPPPGPSRSFYA